MRVDDDREQQYEEERVFGALPGGQFVYVEGAAGEEAGFGQRHGQQPRTPVDQQVGYERVNLKHQILVMNLLYQMLCLNRKHGEGQKKENPFWIEYRLYAVFIVD